MLPNVDLSVHLEHKNMGIVQLSYETGDVEVSDLSSAHGDLHPTQKHSSMDWLKGKSRFLPSNILGFPVIFPTSNSVHGTSKIFERS